MRGSHGAAQLRRVGGAAAVPPVAGVLVALAGTAASVAWSVERATVLSMVLTQLFVLCTGIAAAAALTGDPLVEVHESTPTSFRGAQTVRAAMVSIFGIVGAVVMFVPLHLNGIWPRDQGWITVVTPVGGVILVVAVAAVAATFTGTPSATTIAVIAAWMFLALFWDPYVFELSVQRGVPLLGASALLVVGWRRSGDAERNLERAA